MRQGATCGGGGLVDVYGVFMRSLVGTPVRKGSHSLLSLRVYRVCICSTLTQRQVDVDPSQSVLLRVLPIRFLVRIFILKQARCLTSHCYLCAVAVAQLEHVCIYGCVVSVRCVVLICCLSPC